MSINLGSINELHPICQQHQIIIPSASHNKPPRPLPPNLPRADLIDGRREDYDGICVPLYKASITGNLKAAKVILDLRPELVRFSITESCETVLHIAAMGKSDLFMEYLVSLMTKDDLKLQNGNGQTALYLATLREEVGRAELLVKKNKALLDIPDSQRMMPLCMAALFKRKAMVKYLYHNSQKMTGDFWTHQNRGWVLEKCVEADLLDVAIEIVTDRPELARDGSVLRILARKPQAFIYTRLDGIAKMVDSIPLCCSMIGPCFKERDAFRLLRIILEIIKNAPMDEIGEIIRGPADQTKDEKATTSNYVGKPKDAMKKYLSRILFIAAEIGNTGFVVHLIRQHPNLLREVNNHKQSIFHVAVAHRQVDIYNMLYEIGSIKDLIITLEDENGNNMLHLFGEGPKNNQLHKVSGVVLQLQAELLWFKDIWDLLPPSFREKKNKADVSPREVFTKNYKDLVSKSEKSIKDTIDLVMVVGALIATMAFAAAFTFPGGYSQDNGVPIFLQKQLFKVFMILDALSFISSSASILFVLSILTSRYTEDDFKYLLPRKLLTCLEALFFSIATMILAFVINFFLLYQNKVKWVPALIGAFATFPFVVFYNYEYPHLVNMIFAQYDPFASLHRKDRRIVYKQDVQPRAFVRLW